MNTSSYHRLLIFTHFIHVVFFLLVLVVSSSLTFVLNSVWVHVKHCVFYYLKYECFVWQTTNAQIKVFSECCPMSSDRIVEMGGDTNIVCNCFDTIWHLLKTVICCFHWLQFRLTKAVGFSSIGLISVTVQWSSSSVWLANVAKGFYRLVLPDTQLRYWKNSARR